MAESAAPESPRPALGSTADQLPYVAVSWLAVAAAAAATFLGMLLAIMGVLAFRSHRPLLEEELFFLAILAVVLSFAARRVIRNSEGTRTGTLFGIDLPNYAWWGGLILGLGYLSYFLAIEFSIRKDAQGEVRVWSEQLLKGDEENMNRAFHRTQDPGQRKSIKPTEGATLEARWGKEYTAFQQSDLRRLIARNGAADCKFEIGGLREWKFQPTGIECVYTATLFCPEGTFPIVIPMKGVEGAAAGTDSGGRQWQILHSAATGYIEKERARLTPYGWIVAHLGVTGAELARVFITGASSTREMRATLYPALVLEADADKSFFHALTIPGVHSRAGVIGFPAAQSFSPGPAFLDYASERLFKLKGGAQPDPGRLETFKKAWNETGIVKPCRPTTRWNRSLNSMGCMLTSHAAG